MLPPLPAPLDKLAGCVWLPRFAAKTRLFLAGQLPPEYAERFGAAEGVDGHFFRFFGVTQPEMVAMVQEQPDDEALAEAFRAWPGGDARHIASWNDFAEKLGQPGHPMEDRLHAVLPACEDRFDPSKIRSIFDLITADEREG